MTGAALPTGAAGHTMVISPAAGTDALRATRAHGHPLEHGQGLRESPIAPSARTPTASGSSAARAATDIEGTRGWDAINARGGATWSTSATVDGDRGRGAAVGRDKVILERGDRDDRIAESCERVVKK